MNAQHVNAVTRATKSILTGHLGANVSMGKPFVATKSVPSKEISVILGVNGDLEGQIICSLDRNTTMQLIGRMMGGMEIQAIDEMGWSAVQEFGNWIAGNTSSELSKESFTIDVTPPVINEGNSHFRSNELFITLPFSSDLGAFDINISFSSKSS